MEIPLIVEGLEGQNLIIKSAGMMAGPQLIKDGVKMKPQKGVYSVHDVNGNQVEIKLKYNFIDPIPKIDVGGNVIEVIAPLKWYEYFWAGWPLLLLVNGGAIGGGLGAWAMLTSVRIFRGEKSPSAKYALSGFVAAGAIVIYVVLVSIFYVFIPAEQGQ